MYSKAKQEKDFIKELLEEDPDLLYLTDVGVLLGDYMRATTMLNNNELDPASKMRNYAICLVTTVGKRYDELASVSQ